MRWMALANTNTLHTSAICHAMNGRISHSECTRIVSPPSAMRPRKNSERLSASVVVRPVRSAMDENARNAVLFSYYLNGTSRNGHHGAENAALAPMATPSTVAP